VAFCGRKHPCFPVPPAAGLFTFQLPEIRKGRILDLPFLVAGMGIQFVASINWEIHSEFFKIQQKH